MYYYLHVNGTLTTFKSLLHPAPRCHLFPVYVPLAVINFSSQAFLAVDPIQYLPGDFLPSCNYSKEGLHNKCICPASMASVNSSLSISAYLPSIFQKDMHLEAQTLCLASTIHLRINI